AVAATSSMTTTTKSTRTTTPHELGVGFDLGTLSAATRHHGLALEGCSGLRFRAVARVSTATSARAPRTTPYDAECGVLSLTAHRRGRVPSRPRAVRGCAPV